MKGGKAILVEQKLFSLDYIIKHVVILFCLGFMLCHLPTTVTSYQLNFDMFSNQKELSVLI